MNLNELQRSFHEWGLRDPLWAIATVPDNKGNGWDIESFFQTGVVFIVEVMKDVEA
ncbi:MAG: hypothetical protein ACE5EC_00500 [Phycisphaerae bacterium]